ncbi:Uncharacterised protein [Vibrio cholerae]|nr:Uncharacterised protein [Vibrio cholerae]
MAELAKWCTALLTRLAISSAKLVVTIKAKAPSKLTIQINWLISC